MDEDTIVLLHAHLSAYFRCNIFIFSFSSPTTPLGLAMQIPIDEGVRRHGNGGRWDSSTVRHLPAK